MKQNMKKTAKKPKEWSDFMVLPTIELVTVVVHFLAKGLYVEALNVRFFFF